MSGAGAALPRERLVNIQILRGVAALLVVFAHSIDMSESVSGDWGIRRFGHVENFGAFGVDLFFVISGFVMAFSVSGRRGPRDGMRFLIRRWIRIAPPYLIVGLVMIPIDVAHRVMVDARSVVTLLLFVPVADTHGYTPPPLDVGWTLSFEFTFYLFVALAVVLGVANRSWVLGAGIVVIVLVGGLLPTGPFLLGWFTNPIYLEFALGVGVYAVWSRRILDRRLWLSLSAFLSGVAILVVQLVAGFPPISEAPFIEAGALSATRALLWGVPAALIFLGAVAAPEPSDSWLARGWRRLGDVSYSVYLVHTPVLLAVGALLKRVPIDLPGAPVVLLGLIVGAAAGFPFYRWVERPLTTTLNRRYSARLQRRDGQQQLV